MSIKILLLFQQEAGSMILDIFLSTIHWKHQSFPFEFWYNKAVKTQTAEKHRGDCIVIPWGIITNYIKLEQDGQQLCCL